MPTSIRETGRNTEVFTEVDVVVAGAGTAGVLAAVAAARNGAKTVVLERGGFFGGHIATQLLEHSAGWQDAHGEMIVGGLPVEMIERLRSCGASPGLVGDDTGYTVSRLPVEHELFKSAVAEWMADEGILALPHAALSDFVTDGAKSYAIAETKSGRLAFAAPAMVDATGDADLCARAGCRFHPTEQTQPVSMLFKLGNVDHASLLEYVAAHPGEFKTDAGMPDFRGRAYYNLWGYGALLQAGHRDGLLSLNRNEMHVACHVDSNEAVINVTRYAADATNILDLAAAEVALRRQVREFAAFFRARVPGFEASFLSATAACAGIRESRRLLGRSTLTDADVRSGKAQPDAVARGGFPMDSHDARGNSMDGTEHVRAGYDIPLSALLPATGPDGTAPNIVVAGRCMSAERKALASARITATCMAMGQAAGTAAALSALSGRPMAELPVTELQQKLRAQGAIFQGPTDTPAE